MTGERGRFIAFEGGDGSGKTTQATRLAEALGAVLTREPGSTRLGADLRRLLLDPATGSIDGRTEALLLAADRAQHVAEVIEPALAAGRAVVTDRYIGSTLAYQGYGRGLDLDDLRTISAWATDDLWPDLVVLLDVPGDVAAVRLRGHPDRFEAEADGFHERVRAGFRSLAEADPKGWVMIDAGQPRDVVERAVRSAVADRLDVHL